MTIVYALIIISIAYSAFIVSCYIGFRITRTHSTGKVSGSTFVSVIVPVRNEERLIKKTLEELSQQLYPPHLFEVIIVNDHSTDNTPALIAAFIKEHQSSVNFRYVELDIDSFSKKTAISNGINLSNGTLIITTDADCSRGTNWLPSIVSYFEEYKPEMLCCPVAYSSEKNAFQKIQSLEFCGLIGIAAGSIRLRKPMLCNGANLAFTKNIFHKVNGYDSENSYASGDDTALLKKIAAINPSSIHFLKSTDAIVYTQAAAYMDHFLQQRIRWASKIPFHMSRLTLVVAFIAWLLHAGILVSLLTPIFTPAFSLLLFLPFLIKIFSEFILLNAVTRFLGKQHMLWLLLPAEILYLFYITLVGGLSPFLNFHWKGRSSKSKKIQSSQ